MWQTIENVEVGENLKEDTGKSKGKEKKDKIAIRVSQTQPVTGTTSE